MTFGPQTNVLATAENTSSGNAGIYVVNPLGVALHHYTDALMQQLGEAGIPAELSSIAEPSQSGTSRLKWLTDYSRVLYSAGRRTRKKNSPEKVLVTWPVLGFLDLLLVKVFCGNSGVVVYHDPRPLVRSVGSSKASAGIIRLLRQRPGTLVHSRDAARAMAAAGLWENLTVVPHPMLRPADSGTEGGRTLEAGSRPRVRVLGQYKADRDIGLLALLADRLGPAYDLDIVGRGWPAVPGWKVDARFVPEDELEELIATSDAIVIPYKRFYQSGIAIRALEQAVPVVGRVQTSLSDLYGPQSRLLVPAGEDAPGEVDAWASAIEYAVGEGRTETVRAARQFHSESSRGWASLGRRLLSTE